MIAYSTVGVNDMDAAIAFYDATFGALGAVRNTTSPTWTGYSRRGIARHFSLPDPMIVPQPPAATAQCWRSWREIARRLTLFTPTPWPMAAPAKDRLACAKG